MRKSTGILTVATLAIVVALVGQPAVANCAAPVLMQAIPQIAANPEWVDGSPYMAGVDPISPNFVGYFWALGSGNTALGSGNDNGAYPSDLWVTRTSVDYYGTIYYFEVALRSPDGNILNWTTPAVDGCIGGTNACACVLYSDEYDGRGYFAILGDDPDGNQNYEFPSGGGIFRLAPTPKPVVQTSSREAGTNNLLLQVTVPPLTAGLYQTPGCNCVAGFKVFANVVPRGGLPPAGRRVAADGWVEVASVSGTPQLVTPIGGSAAVRVDCGATNTDVYLATQIMGDSGFGTQLVSENSTRIECGPQLADPTTRPRMQRPTVTGPPDRGR